MPWGVLTPRALFPQRNLFSTSTWKQNAMMARTALRSAGALMALVLLGLWVALANYLFEIGGNQPAPAVILLPLLFFGLAAWALVASVQDEPIMLVLAGGLSFVPIGLFLLFFPGPFRWIGILDLALVATGVALLVLERRASEPGASDSGAWDSGASDSGANPTLLDRRPAPAPIPPSPSSRP